MKNIIIISLALSFTVLEVFATPPRPFPYGYGTFLSALDNYNYAAPFLSCPAYYSSSDAIYALAGPDQNNQDGYVYSLQSNLNPNYNLQYQIFQGQIFWDSDSGMPTPAIANDGSTYVVTPSGVLYGFEPNGTTKWIYYGIGIDGGNVLATPTIGLDGNIYIATDDANRIGVFYCIDPDLGLPKWKLHLNSSFPDMDASPLFTTSGIYDTDEAGLLHFITFYGQEYVNANAPLYTGSDGEPSSSAAMTSQGLLCVATGDGNLEIIDPIAQTILQTIPLFGTAVSASPVIGPDGNVYIGDNAGNFFAVSLPANQRLSPPTIIAETTLNGIPTTAAVGSDSSVYVGTSTINYSYQSSSGSLYKMHLQSVSGGSYPYQFVVDWQTNIIAGYQGGGFIGSPLIAQVGTSHNNNVVYAPNVNGNIYAFLASAGPSTTTWSTFQGNDQRQGSWGNGTITQPNLWSIQFGPAPVLSQVGKAAYGNSSSDYWNAAVIPYHSIPNPQWAYTVKNSAGIKPVYVIPSSGCFFGLDDDVNGVYNPFDDYLMSELVTATNSSFSLEILSLPTKGFTTGATALYDVYVYAYAGQALINGQYQNYNSKITITPAGTDPVSGQSVPTLTTASSGNVNTHSFAEGVEYVVFRNVPVTARNPNIIITAQADPNNPVSFPFINGIQIVAKQ